MVQKSWRRTIPAPSASAAMAVDTSGVVVASGNRVSRFASTDGQLEWERELGGVLSSPAVSGDRVFVGSTDNYLYSLDTSTGRIVWRYGTGGDVVGATADDRFVYFAALDNLLRALRRGNGEPGLEARPLDANDCTAVDVRQRRCRQRKQSCSRGVQCDNWRSDRQVRAGGRRSGHSARRRCARAVSRGDDCDHSRRAGDWTSVHPDDVSRAASRPASGTAGPAAQQRAFFAPELPVSSSQFPKQVDPIGSWWLGVRRMPQPAASRLLQCVQAREPRTRA